MVELHLALSPWTTGYSPAWINALLVDTSLIQRTFVIPGTLILEAFSIRATGPSDGAPAHSSVARGKTLCVSPTDTVSAWVNTLVFNACEVVRALSVKVTLASFDWITSVKAIAFKSWRTQARSSVVSCLASGKRNARVFNPANVDAGSITATLMIKTVIVCVAFFEYIGSNIFLATFISSSRVSIRTGTGH